MSFYIFTLKDMLKSDDNPMGSFGESEIKSILSDFSCPYNKDIESFIRVKAIEFSKQSVAETYLVYADYQERAVLVGYFTLANKMIVIPTKHKRISNGLRKRLSKFSMNIFNERIQSEDSLMIPSILIAQLSKNFNNGYNKLITGDELLNLAIAQIKKVQRLIGGKVCYLECEDKDFLLNFYSENGFVNFGKRLLEHDEKEQYEGHYLIQMLKYI